MRAANKIYLKDKPDIRSILVHEGVALKQRGRTFWACCPFHSEKTPSFKADPDRQTFYCFGCHESGDVIALVRKLHGLSFKDACSYLGLEKSRPDPALIAEYREKKELLAAFRQWEKEHRDEIAEVLRRYHYYGAAYVEPFTENELQELAFLQEKIDYLKYVYEILCGKDDRLKYELFREDMGYAR